MPTTGLESDPRTYDSEYAIFPSGVAIARSLPDSGYDEDRPSRLKGIRS